MPHARVGRAAVVRDDPFVSRALAAASDLRGSDQPVPQKFEFGAGGNPANRPNVLDTLPGHIYRTITPQETCSMSVQMELSKIIISEMQDQQIIVLTEVDGERKFPIVIGSHEALAIDRRLKGQFHPR